MDVSSDEEKAMKTYEKPDSSRAESLVELSNTLKKARLGEKPQ